MMLVPKTLPLEIAHVLFIDIVGYSKLLADQQVSRLQILNSIVRKVPEVRRANADGKLLRLPTGDGMALVFFTGPIDPVRCAIEISRALKQHLDLKVRMGIHSGSVVRVLDTNERANVAGEGINIAQRVMDTGDEGHILLSNRVAGDLTQLSDWLPYVHDLGEVEVKHQVVVRLFNLYTADAGNPERPKKVRGRSSRIRQKITSVAVLPLLNDGDNPDTNYLVDGVTEGVINRLSQLAKLRVIARSTVFRYKGGNVDPIQVGRELEVDAVMSGRVLQRGEMLVIKVDLVKAKTGSQIWGETYNRKLAEVMSIQQDISKEISEKLTSKLTRPEKKQLGKYNTADTEAYAFYLKGRYAWNRRTEATLKEAINYFNLAVHKDGNFAAAHAGLADCYNLLNSYKAFPASEAILKAKAAAEKALQIDPNLAEAHASLGHSLLNYDWDWLAAEREFQQAIELNRNYSTAHHWYSTCLRAMGRFQEAIAEAQQALELDPLSSIVNTNLALHFYYARQYDESVEQFAKALELDPNFHVAHMIGLPYLQKGEHEAALAEFWKAVKLSGAQPETLACLGHAYALVDSEVAYQILAVLSDFESGGASHAYDKSVIYAGLGKKEEAFTCLKTALENSDQSVTVIKVDPRLDELRSDARFVELLSKVRLQ